jgi:predicted dehydrogenase
MGRWHADAARRMGACIVAIVDPVSDRARVIAGAAGSTFVTLDAALTTPVDVVHICTPLETHVALSRQALAAGCHVIVEKPATPTLAEAEALAYAARAAGRMLVPVHQFVFQKGIRHILARREGIGPFRHIEFAVCSAGADSTHSVDRDQIAAEIAPHAFALARALLRTSMAGLDWHLERAAPGEWRFSATTTVGCTVAALISMSARPTFATCRVLGEHGSAMADLFQGFSVFEPDMSSPGYKVMRPLSVSLRTAGASAWQLASRALLRERAYPGLRGLIAATYAAIAGRGAAPFRNDELVDVAAAREHLLTLAAPSPRQQSMGS